MLSAVFGGAAGLWRIPQYVSLKNAGRRRVSVTAWGCAGCKKHNFAIDFVYNIIRERCKQMIFLQYKHNKGGERYAYNV